MGNVIPRTGKVYWRCPFCRKEVPACEKAGFVSRSICFAM